MTDWKERALLAESALQLARSGLALSTERKAVLSLLADLRRDDWLSTTDLAQLLQWDSRRTLFIAHGLVRLGLAEQDGPRRGGRGNPVSFRLGYMVQVPE
jgi:hypothetical protein